jgi:hypothetical protein
MALKKVVACRLTPILYEILQEKSGQIDVSVGVFLRLIVERYIEVNCKNELQKHVFKQTKGEV